MTRHPATIAPADQTITLPAWPTPDLDWRSAVIDAAKAAGWPPEAVLLTTRWSWDVQSLASGQVWEEKRQRRVRWLGHPVPRATEPSGRTIGGSKTSHR